MVGRLNSSRGYTLQEIIVVLVIIGVLLGMAVPAGMRMMNDATTHEFATNAKTFQDNAHVLFRDTGVLPVAEEVGTGDLTVTERSKLVIRNELIKAGVADSETIVNNLIEDGYVRLLAYDDLVGYSTLSKDAEGAAEFVIVDVIEDIDASRYGFYENDIAGFVFSLDVRENSSGEMYSGAYKLDSGYGDKELDDIETDLNEDVLTDASSLKPYGFRVANVVNNKNGTADVTVTWTNLLTELVGSDEELKRGYISEEYTLTCDVCATTTTTFGKDDVETVLDDVSIGNVNLTLRSDRVVFSGSVVPGTTRIAEINADLLDMITNPGDGVVEVNDDIDEVLEGDQFDNRDDLYKELEESTTFAPDQVTAIPEGLQVNGVAVGDRIVLKEVRKEGTVYDYDRNRTRLFISKATDVLIPKDPYLQKDFQTNPYSEYEYIVEVYKNIPCTTCSGKTAPDNAAVVYYD